MPDIALIGAGPVGSLLASALLSNGVEFTWVIRNPLRAAELRTQLTLQLSGPTLHLPTDARRHVEYPSDAIRAGWTILAVKAQHVLPLLAELSPYPGGKVLAVANGIHDGPFHLGLLFGGAYIHEGVLHTDGANTLIVGPLGVYPDWSAELLSTLEQPWLHVDNESSIELRMWRKAALNCIVNPLTALLDCPNGELLSQLDSPLITGLLSELEVLLYRASDQRLVLAPGQLRAELEQLLIATASNSSSMREDIRAGRETEIELLNLAVAKIGRQNGLDCILNESLGRMVARITNTQRL
jgi:2-dehydropantoate 2-reductase